MNSGGTARLWLSERCSQSITKLAVQICHPEIVAAIKATADEQGIRLGALPSGGRHDTQQMSRIARAGMIFVRSKDGRSHTPEEFSSIEDIVEAVKVLAGTLHRLAY